MANDTPFSFHCMICFEEFDSEVRYPVVLPCGHTYVCHECGDRLDKCMECRTPLYIRIPRGEATRPKTAQEIALERRYGSRNQTLETNPQPPIKKRLPLPKNVVLLSLIEATELATQDVVKKDSGGSSPSNAVGGSSEQATIDPIHRTLRSLDSMMDEEEADEKIKVGTSLAAGVSGTYAVAVHEGLEIYPNRPDEGIDTSNALTDEDVDTLVRFFHLDHQGTSDGEGRDSPASRCSSKQEKANLSFGDRVQIVSFERGWAKLSRGYGYVRADKNQLVKVGNAVDRACKLEAMLRKLSNRRKELRMKQNQVDNQFIRLMNDLQLSLQNDEDLTVICADTFSVPQAALPSAAPSEEQERENRPTESTEEKKQDSESLRVAFKPTPLDRQPTPPQNSSSLVCFANDVLNSAHIRGTLSPPFLTNASDCGAPFDAVGMFSQVPQPSPSDLRAGARAWRERQSKASRVGQIDFRTGMSGHMALLSSHAHSHEYLEPGLLSGPSVVASKKSSTPGRIPKMSSHTGLTMSRPHLSFLGRLTLPLLGSSTTPSTDPRDRAVQQSGSM